ncbi:gastrula zinc finger protein XlCGF57.1-like [Entelurus aequoreus]|uniref:gastrula zinc finger protein XlCGF57.1-like n=1 Tax=Entelurus aequoreus TaxID=161455 RepID=UPI002B1DB423|nr:gastrula zinc finger protein XlCGF57.1-like [Entelurus aequoreus]
MLKNLVKERLMAAADEIFGLFERTIASYEEELSRRREDNWRQQQQLDAVYKNQIVIQVGDIQQLIARQDGLPLQPQEGSSTLKQQDPQPPHIKEEEEEPWVTHQGGERFLEPKDDLCMLPLTAVSVKTEDHEDQPLECSPLHRSPDKEPPSSSSLLHITEDDGGDCGGSQANNLLASLSDSDDTMSPCLEDGHDAQEPLSSDTDYEGDTKTHTDNKNSECSEKKKEKPFSCSMCGKIFSDKSNMKRHLSTHIGEKPFCCSVCGKIFLKKSAMVYHMRTHTGDKPFGCSVCDKTFSSKSIMLSHRRTHTGEKPFSCSICCKTFTQKPHMVSHMRTHTGEKPFRCSVCDKAFSLKSNVVTHMRTHTGEKPFSCLVCGERFSQKTHMVSHMRAQKGQQPFSCIVCGKLFCQRSNRVAKHMETHTAEKNN